ncbi:hypothetical protein IHE61_31090 [Streptomyces sp. GKU 257-1]|nr:hypothetical protein [Streptomyces sp. GKU 257-1]
MWRTDSQHSPWARAEARQYLTILRDDYGYEPTPIEAAVINDQPYEPEPDTAAPAAVDTQLAADED